MAKNQSAPALPPGTEALFSVTCKDVVMGRGSGTQNHCGNVTYRKLVFLNKELYATSSKFDKLKISKAIVAAVREFGGHFVQADEKRGGLYFDIGDKRAWDKTSQALREGQAEIRAKLAEEDPNGMDKIAEYKQVISEQTFFAYACRMMESLYHPADGESGITACGQMCPHAKRRQTLNRIGAHPMQIHQAMQSLTPPPLPPVQNGQQYYQQQPSPQQQQPYCQPSGQPSYGADAGQVTPTICVPALPSGEVSLPSIEPLPLNAPATSMGSLDPLAYVEPLTAKNAISGGSVATGGTQPSSYPSSLAPSETSTSSDYEPIPYQRTGVQKPAPLAERGTLGSVFSLRKFCSEDFEMSSEEGQALMEQLNQEVDDLIRRKSYGLIQIDTKQAFEDLVFEEDSMMFDEALQEAVVQPKKGKRGTESSSSSSGTNRVSKSTSSGMSGLSFKDDISLMNMSILTLDEKPEDERKESDLTKSTLTLEGAKNEPTPTRDGSTPKSIYRQSDPSLPKDIRKRGTRVSFAGRNISLMSMDERSFSQLVDSISDPEVSEGQPERTMSEGSSQSISRKMGFPMRKTVAEKLVAGAGVGPPTEVGSSEAGPQEKVSSLTISEDTPVKNEGDPFPNFQGGSGFTKKAGQVSDPGVVANSLNLDMSISNVSALNMSTMSLASDIDEELLK